MGPLPGIPASQDIDVLDLRAPGTRRDIQGHRRALVQGMPATMGPVRALQANPPGPRRNHQRTAVLDLPRPDPAFWHNCPGCGQTGRLHQGRCARCAVDRRLRDLLGDASGEIRPELRALYQALTGTERPDTVVSWLGKSAGPRPCATSEPGSPSPTSYLTGCPPASRSSICAASWSPSGHYRRVMSR